MSREGTKREGSEGGGSRNKDQMREGDWLCGECSSHNYNARITCYRCTLPKEKSELMLKGKSALDWECFPCKMTNFGWRQECFKCHITRQGSEDLKARQVGVEWFCRFCNLKNFPNRNDCFKCKRTREFCDTRRRSRSPPRGMRRSFSPGRRSPPRMRGPSPPRRPMSPPRRGRSPPPRRHSRSPIRRKAPSPPPSQPRRMSPPPSQDAEWKCNLCATFNGLRRKDCYKCTTPKPNAGPKPGPSLLGQVFGDESGGSSWDCPDCHIKNYSFRTECFKCKTPKPDELNKPNPRANFNNRPSNKGPSNKSLLSTPVSRPDDYYEPESPPQRLDTSSARQQHGPDWSCRFCNVDIFPTRNDCYKCGRTRDECDSGGADDLFNSYNQNKRASTNAPLIADRPKPVQSDGYTCGCGTFNRCDETSCNWCGKLNPGRAAPPARSQVSGPKTEWDCRDCRINNFHYRTTCFKCNKSREECEEVRVATRDHQAGSSERRMSPRRQDRRERSPVRRTLLPDRHEPPPPRSRFSPPPFRGGRSRSPPMRRGPSPPRRGFSPPRRGRSPPRRGRSPPFRGRSPQRGGRSPQRGGRSPPRTGPGKNYQPDWECKDCNINNFVKRTKCFRCGKERTEVQVVVNADGKPIGPNDWLCPKCDGHNFSRRETCYKCKTDKPGNKREEDKNESPREEDSGDVTDDLVDMHSIMQGNMDRVEIDAM